MKVYLITLAIAFTVLSCFIRLGKADDIRIISLTSNDIIYDPVTQKIYASVPSRAGATGNSITIIDPFTGTVDTSIFIGSEPSKLAISDDGQYLYVALDGAASVRQFDITSQTAELQFALGSDPFNGPYYAEDIEVLPGDPEVIAVSTKYLGVSPRFAGVGIYDNGVQRPTRVPGFSGTGEHVNVIEFSSSSSILYGASTTSSPTKFYRMSVDTNGVSITNDASSIIPGGFSSGDIEFDGGLIYTAQGGLIDPEAQLLLGTFMLPSSDFVPLVRPDSSAGRVYFLTVSGSDGTIIAFHNQTFLPIGTLTISGLSFADFLGPSSLISWDRDALAFRSTGDQLVLLRDFATAVADQNSDQIPATFSLSQNYPNPFNAETVIKYQLPKNGQVELAIFNVLGQRVKVLVNEFQSSGSYQFRWHGTDELERRVTSGVYIIRLQSHSFVQTRKIIFLQ